MTHVVSRYMDTRPYQDKALATSLFALNRLNNSGVKYLRKRAYPLRGSDEYRKIWETYCSELDKLREDGEIEDKKKRKAAFEPVRRIWAENGLSVTQLKAHVTKVKNESFVKSVHAHWLANVQEAVWQQAYDYLTFQTDEIKFKKKGQIKTLRGKEAKTGIIYRNDDKGERVSVFGIKGDIPLAPIREGDGWLASEMEGAVVKYATIVEEPRKAKVVYRVDFTCEDAPVSKVKLGCGKVGIDPGTSIMAYVADNEAGYYTLAPEIERYNKQIAEAARAYDRARHDANPDNYLPDGQIRRDSKDFTKKWRHTPRMRKCLMRIRDAYRKRSQYVKATHGEMVNHILSLGDVFIVEKMDYAALAKKAKRQELPDVDCETVEIIDSIEGTVVAGSKEETLFEELSVAADEVEAPIARKGDAAGKNKRRRRFGRSINMRAPALFLSTLKRRTEALGGRYIDVPCSLFALSQLDHVTRAKTKIGLSARTKLITLQDGSSRRVQRDLYSAFLAQHIRLDEDYNIVDMDFEACLLDFSRFLECQEQVVLKLADTGDATGNFGLVDFTQES